MSVQLVLLIVDPVELELTLSRKPNPCLAIGTYTSWERIPYLKPVAVSQKYLFPPD